MQEKILNNDIFTMHCKEKKHKPPENARAQF